MKQPLPDLYVILYNETSAKAKVISPKKNQMGFFKRRTLFFQLSFAVMLLLILATFFSERTYAQGFWTPVTTTAPDLNAGVMLLLSDGSVMAMSATAAQSGIGDLWDRLTPDIHGSYINGTWSSISPMIDTRLYFSSQVLMDGRVYVAGGEYGTGGSYAEVYDPITDEWTATPNIGIYISDANTEILPDGRVLQALVGSTGSRATIIYNPETNNWNFGPTAIGSHNESAWVKLPDSSILFVDVETTNSERYIPSLNQWISDADLPVEIYDPTYEMGGGLLLPDGRAFFLGGTGATVYYTPSGTTDPGTWEQGPDIPDGLGVPDAAAAMMVNGKILCAVSPPNGGGNYFSPPTSYYEFDYLTDSFTQIDAPSGGQTVNQPCYFTGMLDLPDGNVLYADQYSNQYYVYTPDGTPLEEGKPTIESIIRNGCDSFTVTGTLFNGISEGATYGDDWQMNTNYPIVRLTAGTNVYYARTYNWNRTGVQTGTLPDTTQFVLPAGLPDTIFTLVVIANGIASDSVPFTPYPMLSSTLTPPDICSNTEFTYSPASFDSSATFTWTREAVAGISNAEITDPQATDPEEILINTTTSPVSVIYVYTITANGCSSTQEVTVIVNPSPSISISGTFSVCVGESTTLTAAGGTNYLWSNNETDSSITVSPITSTTYSVTSTDSSGCTGMASQEVIVNPLPEVDFAGLPDTACTFTEGIPLTGIPSGGEFSGDGMVGNVFSPSGASVGNDTVTYSYTDSFGCENSISQVIYVSLCTGIASIGNFGDHFLYVYPNPADELITVAFAVTDAGPCVIKLLDMLGRTIRNEDLKAVNGDNTYVMNLEGIAKGQYMITLQKDDDVFKAKIVVE